MVYKYFIKLHTAHCGPIYFVNFLAVASFHPHKICFAWRQKTEPGNLWLLYLKYGFYRLKSFALEANNNRKPALLEPVLLEWYGGCGTISHWSCKNFWLVTKLVWGLALSWWGMTAHFRINRCPVKPQRKNDFFETPPNR